MNVTSYLGLSNNHYFDTVHMKNYLHDDLLSQEAF